MSNKQRKVPLPVVLLLIAGIIAAAWYGISTYRAPAHSSGSAEVKAASSIGAHGD